MWVETGQLPRHSLRGSNHPSGGKSGARLSVETLSGQGQRASQTLPFSDNEMEAIVGYVRTCQSKGRDLVGSPVVAVR